jgi:hypothetical protein
MSQLPILAAPNRRQFLGACAACAASAFCPRLTAGASRVDPAAAPVQPVLRLVFTHVPVERETWPYLGYDYEGRKKELTARLEKACPNVKFLPATAHNVADARRILLEDAEVDGYVVYMIGIWTGAALTIAASNRPTLFVDDLYAGSGEFLTAYAAAKRKGFRVAPVSSSRFEDVPEAIKAFETIKRLRSAVILDVTERDPGLPASAIQDTFGSTVQRVGAEEFNEAYRAADRTEAKQWADRWVRGAAKVVEPSRQVIDDSALIFIGMRDLMQRHRSDAITVDCLSLFYSGKMPAYPCLGFFQLNNDGKVGACEADLRSTISMLLMTYLTGRPGYISDPVIDTAKNQIIYAHCVAPTKVYGPEGPSNPYHIRSHSEDRQGASIRSLMPLNEMTTTLLFDAAKREVVFHQGKSAANIDEDMACRTKLAVEVKDPDKLLSEWDRWGWHRVTFYGDLRRPVKNIAALLGFGFTEEG